MLTVQDFKSAIRKEGVGNPDHLTPEDISHIMNFYLTKRPKVDHSIFTTYFSKVPLLTLSNGLKCFIDEHAKITGATLDIIKVAINIMDAELRREYELALTGLGLSVLLVVILLFQAATLSGVSLILVLILGVGLSIFLNVIVYKCLSRRNDVRQCVMLLVLEAKDAKRGHANLGKLLAGSVVTLVALGLITHTGFGTGLLVTGTKLICGAISVA
jgi:hypothetical protein